MEDQPLIRVAHLSTHWRRTVGGISRNISRLHDELNAKGNVRSIVITEEDPEAEDEVYQVRYGRLREAISTLRALRVARPEIIHCHDNLWMGLGAVLYMRLIDPKARLIYTVHTLHDAQKLNHFDLVSLKRWIEFKGRTLVSRLICATASLLIAVTPAAARYLQEVEGVSQSREIMVVPFGADVTPVSQQEIDEFKRQHQLSDDDIVLSTVGVLFHDWKVRGVELLMEALVELKEYGPFVLLIVGDGQHRERLKYKAIELGVTDRVRFVGDLRRADVAFCATDIYCHAALNEAQGMAVVEAMLYSLPIVVVNRGGLPFLITHEKTGLVCEPDPHALAAAVIKLMKSMDQATELGHAARVEAQSRFSWVAVVDRHAQMYRLLLVR